MVQDHEALGHAPQDHMSITGCTHDTGIAAIDVEWIEAPIEAVAGISRSSWTDCLIERSRYATAHSF